MSEYMKSDLLQDRIDSEMDKVLEKIDATKKKYKELKEQMDKSRVDLSLLDELFMFNSYYQNRPT